MFGGPRGAMFGTEGKERRRGWTERLRIWRIRERWGSSSRLAEVYTVEESITRRQSQERYCQYCRRENNVPLPKHNLDFHNPNTLITRRPGLSRTNSSSSSLLGLYWYWGSGAGTRLLLRRNGGSLSFSFSVERGGEGGRDGVFGSFGGYGG